ncbi:guanylate kinase [Roseburia hominis]
MGKIFYLMGKSSSGKDTIYKELREMMPQLKTVTIYTTRPIREGETEGVEYHFVGEKELDAFLDEGKVIELRAYDTVYGVWKYFTVDDGQFDLAHEDFLMIGTLESYEKMREYFGEQVMVPLYIEVEDGERLSRALRREREQREPKYAEMCRRFLADTQDFAEENIERLGIRERFENIEINETLRKISERIQNLCENLD